MAGKDRINSYIHIALELVLLLLLSPKAARAWQKILRRPPPCHGDGDSSGLVVVYSY